MEKVWRKSLFLDLSAFAYGLFRDYRIWSVFLPLLAAAAILGGFKVHNNPKLQPSS